MRREQLSQHPLRELWVCTEEFRYAMVMNPFRLEFVRQLRGVLLVDYRAVAVIRTSIDDVKDFVLVFCDSEDE